MITRLYKPEDYAEISRWWTQRRLAAVPKSILPKTGIVSEDATGSLAAAWVYLDNSVGLAWLAWVVTRPGLPGRRAPMVLQGLVGCCEAVAEELGYKVMFTMTHRPGFGRWLQREGFTANHSGMVQFFKELK